MDTVWLLVSLWGPPQTPMMFETRRQCELYLDEIEQASEQMLDCAPYPYAVLDLTQSPSHD